MATEEKAPEEEAVPPGAEDAGPSDAEAPEEDAPLAPIIVKKIEGGHGGAHGGGWKIALADMMTAMMAFFLLMWILGATNDSQRKSVADYFKPTSQSVVAMGQLAGSNGIMGGRSIIDPDGFPYTAKQTAALQMVTPRSEGGPTENDPSPNSENDRAKERDGMNDSEKKKIVEQADKENFDKLEKEVREQLEQNPNLEKMQGQVQFVREKEGLRIEIIDKADFSMFGLGTSQMQGGAQELITEVAKALAGMNNKIAVRGHTDSLGFAKAGARNNWSLSAERAEATRAMFEKKGIKADRFAQIEGVADTMPYNNNDPKDPRNRRISVTVKYRDGE
jgi:chemotaxis protein MotB